MSAPDPGQPWYRRARPALSQSLSIAVANVALPRTFRVVPHSRLLDRGQHDARYRIQALVQSAFIARGDRLEVSIQTTSWDHIGGDAPQHFEFPPPVGPADGGT